MFEIKYNIGINKYGRPCIELPEDYEQNPEDKFFALEICRYIFQDLLNRRISDLDNQTIRVMDETERFLGQLGDDVAEIIRERMIMMGEIKMIFDNKYHIEVNSIEERDNLPEKDILFEDKIFNRVEGLKVWVNYHEGASDADIYKLSGGITNDNWVKI